MSFISIRQYFNKLQIIFLSLMMVPLLAFIALSLLSREQGQGKTEHYLVIIPLAFFSCILAILNFNKKIKSARNVQGLGTKLDKYLNITIVRYCLVSLAGALLATGFFLTMSQVFTALYLLNLSFGLLLWPTGPRVSRELKLRGDEQEMVYFRKDSFG